MSNEITDTMFDGLTVGARILEVECLSQWMKTAALCKEDEEKLTRFILNRVSDLTKR